MTKKCLTSEAFGRFILSWITLALCFYFHSSWIQSYSWDFKRGSQVQVSLIQQALLLFCSLFELPWVWVSIHFLAFFFFLRKLPEKFWIFFKLQYIMWNYYLSFPPTLPLCLNSGGPLAVQPLWPVMEVQTFTCQSTTLKDLRPLLATVLSPEAMSLYFALHWFL